MSSSSDPLAANFKEKCETMVTKHCQKMVQVLVYFGVPINGKNDSLKVLEIALDAASKDPALQRDLNEFWNDCDAFVCEKQKRKSEENPSDWKPGKIVPI